MAITKKKTNWHLVFCAHLLLAISLCCPTIIHAEAFFSDSNATGFFVSANGHLVTAYHAVENRKISVIMPGKRAVIAEVIKFSKASDLALLKIPESTPFLQLALPEDVQTGLEIATIGYPMMSVQGTSAKLSRGIINSMVGFHEDPNSFQFDAATARGSSGGPVMGPSGLVVGVVNGKLHTTKVMERTKEWIVNVNYATNVQTLIRFLSDVDDIPAPRRLPAGAALNIQQLFADHSAAIIAVVSDMSAMKGSE